MTKQYILNQETQRIEIHFSKPEYQALSLEEKKKIKGAFLFSGKAQAWVSRSTKDHYSALKVAKELGFVDGGKTGERLSFAEEVERKAQKAEARSERYEARAERAVQEAQQLQQGWNDASQDWSYVTQPIIAGHAGSQRFARQRQRLLDRYTKGFEEYRKSEHFKEKAVIAQTTANMHQFKSRSYLSNRIEECNKNLRAYERALKQAEQRENEERIAQLLEKIEYEVDKLAYMTNKLEELGGIQHSKESLKVGYEVKIRGHWDKVVKLNPKTVEVKPSVVPYTLKYPYAEIQDVRIPSDWQDPAKEETINPFEINDIVAHYAIGGDRIIKAFQVVKKSAKSVTLQEIQVKDNVPQLNQFVDDKIMRRNIKEKQNNTYVVNYGDWYLYKYTAAA